MRKHYDFPQAKKNPYAKRLKKAITIRLDESTVGYFKELAAGEDRGRQRSDQASGVFDRYSFMDQDDQGV